MEEILLATKWIQNATDKKRRYIYEFVANSEEKRWGHIDVAPRYHCKSLALTYAGIIQLMIIDSEKTIGLFSYKSKLAKSFLAQIQAELENNLNLKELFPDVFYQNPQKESPKWSENEGILIRRKGNPREVTLTASGLVDGQTTGAHYNYLWFDDAIEKEAGGSPYMMAKAEESLRLVIGGLGTHDKQYGGVGTRWNLFDAYKTLEADGVIKIRRTEGVTPNERDGTPLYLTADEWENAKREFSDFQFSCQMLNEPNADSSKAFNYDWLQWYVKITDGWRNMNRYIIVDPANSKSKDADSTAMIVVGIQGDGNYYVLDAVRDKLSLPERIDKLFALYIKWKPIRIGYEEYAVQADIDAIKMKSRELMFNLPIVKLGGKIKKEDRIEGLMPLAKQEKLYLPRNLMYRNWEGQMIDLIDYFVNFEYLPFPNGRHDDMLDALARITDPALGISAPEIVSSPYTINYNGHEIEEAGSWLSA